MTFAKFTDTIARAKLSDLNALHHNIWLARDAGQITADEHDELVKQLDKQRARSRHERRSFAKRAKIFGDGYAKPLQTNGKRALMKYAYALMGRSEADRSAGRHYGALTPKYIAVLRALLWKFHNAISGLCFPSYEALAEAADCGRTTVYEAIRALEDAGILSWANRLKRVWEEGADLFGRANNRQRVVRTSNGYSFREPPPETAGTSGNSSKFGSRTGTEGLASTLSSLRTDRAISEPTGALGEAMARLRAAIQGAS
jgi:Helix-turn-helix domain